MNDCQVVAPLLTPFVDGEASEHERQLVARHLRTCVACRRDVEAESIARREVRAYASAARTMGVPLSPVPALDRRFVRRLARHPLLWTAAAALALLLVALGSRPSLVEAVGIIGDSFCGPGHRLARGRADDRTCTLNCVKGGARFILVSESAVYDIVNQGLPGLASFADTRVRVSGTLENEALRIRRIVATED